MRISIQLTQNDLYRAALVKAGGDPAKAAKLPGTRWHQDKKRSAKNGQTKHRSRQFDC